MQFAELLNQSEVERIHEASLELFESVEPAHKPETDKKKLQNCKFKFLILVNVL